MNQETVHQLLNHDTIKIILIAGVAVVWIMTATITKLMRGLSRERTRREIAAYVAEGTMTVEQGERIIVAGKRREETTEESA